MRLTLVKLVVFMGLATAQFPHKFNVRPRVSLQLDRYHSNYNDEDGRYTPTDDGKYVPDDSGKYIHVDEGYNGGYGDSGSRGGYYNGDTGNYNHIDGGIGSGSGYQGNRGGLGHGNSDHSGKYSSDNIGASNVFKNSLLGSKIITTPLTNTIRNHGLDRPSVHVGKYVPTVKYGNEGGWKIIRMEKSMQPPYHYLYETENRILAEEEGHIQPIENNEEAMRAFGFYQYYGDDGEKYRVDYTADENGFIPKGDHIPQALQRAFAYLARSNKV